MADEKLIVILGGSYGGVGTAHNLLKHAIPKLPSHRVVLVSPSPEVWGRPAAPRAMISDEFFDQSKLFVSIPKIFAQYPSESFRFVHGTATSLDHAGRTVTVTLHDGSGTEKLNFHALVIATGSSSPSPLFSMNRDPEFLRASWAAFRKALPEAKSIVIAGGGPVGVESAGELGEYLNGWSGMFSSKLENPKVPITLVTAASNILPISRPAVAKKAEGFLARVGVTILKNTKIVEVTPSDAGTEQVGSKAQVKLADGKTLDADIYIPAIGTRPNSGFIDRSLLAEDGRVATNTSTLRVDKAGERIYAIGDVSSAARPAIHLVNNAVPILAANIKRDLLLAAGKPEAEAGKERVHEEDKRETHIVPIGKSKGVGAASGYQLPSFMVWLLKGRDYWLWTTDALWSGKQWAKET